MALQVPEPSTYEDRLAQAFRRRQARIAAETALKVGRYWKGVEVGNEQSESNFIQLSLQDLSSGFLVSADDSREFVSETLETPTAPPMVSPMLEQMARSMAYVGPVQARKAMLQSAGTDFEMTAEEARKHVENQVRGAAVRLTALGGREVVCEATTGRRVGYIRVTGSNPCAFCAMLASRRAVFEEDSFDDSDARFSGWGKSKVHDSCQCALIPVTQASQERLTQMNYFEQLWKDLSGKDRKESDSSPLVTFRRNYEKLRTA